MGTVSNIQKFIETDKQNTKTNKFVRKQRRELKDAIGHEVKEITPLGDIVLKDRLKPKHAKRVVKKTKYMNF